MGCCRSSPIAINEEFVDVSHFSLERVLGRGGYGQVRAAVKRTGADKGEWFAVKMTRKQRGQDFVNGVFIELHALAKLNHPNITNGRYAFQDEAMLYLVLDLCMGGDLRYMLDKQGPIEEGRANFYVAQISMALIHIHTCGLLHRDLKPENIMLTGKGYVKLTDFGVSMVLDPELPPEQQCSTQSGTMGYMAPEVYLDGNLHGTPSDWFSLGVCLFELLADQLPYTNEAFDRLIGQDTIPESMKPANINRLARSHLSENCVAVVTGLLQARPANRLCADVQDQPWWEGNDWEKLLRQEYSAPFLPSTKQVNCDVELEVEEVLLGSRRTQYRVNGTASHLNAEDQAQFREYELNTRYDGEPGDWKLKPVRPSKKPWDFGGGGVWAFAAATVVSYVGCKLFFSRGKEKKLKKDQKAQMEKLYQQYHQQLDRLIDIYDDEINQHHYALVQAANTIEQLEQLLYKLPDVNNDNLISRTEFNDYMKKYKSLHPEIRDVDLPSFGDMDHDGNGYIRFNEWEQYQIAAMNGQV